MSNENIINFEKIKNFLINNSIKLETTLDGSISFNILSDIYV